MFRSPDGYARTIAVALGLLLLSALFQELATIPALLVDPALLEFDAEEVSRIGVILYLPLAFIGLGVAAILYLVVTGRDWAWLDLKRPGKQAAIWVVGGSVLAFSLNVIAGILMSALEIELPANPVLELLGGDVLLLAYMLLVIWLFNAPAEELLFRNVIQKRSYAAFSELGAVVFTSVLFALIHLPGYLLLGAPPVALIIPAGVLFGGSIIMGIAYVRTENLLVPILIHGIFNSILVTLLLIAAALEIDLEEASATIISIVTTVM